MFLYGDPSGSACNLPTRSAVGRESTTSRSTAVASSTSSSPQTSMMWSNWRLSGQRSTAGCVPALNADLHRFGRRHAGNLGVEAKGYRLSDARSRWGSCGRDGVVRVHWRLSQAPRMAMEYVVAHELVHLLHRNHSSAF